MEIKIIKKDNTFKCDTLHDTEKFYIITEFMMGDADGYETITQDRFSKLTKDTENYIMALNAMVGCHNDDEFKFYEDCVLLDKFEFDFPYCEFSSYSFQSFDIIYFDKDRNIFRCEIIYNENELNIIKSFDKI